MELGRRRFIASSLALCAGSVLPCDSLAFPLPKLLGNPEGIFVKSYIERYLKWYQSHWKFEVPQKYSNIIKTWKKEIESFGIVKDSVFFEFFLSRHFLGTNSSQHGRLYFGLPNWSQSLVAEIQKVTASDFPKTETSQLPWEDFFGFSFDTDNPSTKLYFWNTKSVIINKQFSIPPDPTALYYLESFRGKTQLTGLIKHQKNIPLKGHIGLIDQSVIGGFKVLRSDGSQSFKIRTRSTLYGSLPKGTPKIAVTHKKEFHQQTDFLDTSQAGTLKIYYP